MRSARIVILGGTGMLGHKMFQILREAYEGVVCVVREDVRGGALGAVDLLYGKDVIAGVDAGDFEGTRAKLSELRPEFTINCVGVIKQRDSAHYAIPSITINSLLPHKLCEMASAWGGKVIHFSTDCVFSGKKGSYSEEDFSDATDLYGKSKYLGEITESNGLTLRTSIIGRELKEHRSLLDWFLAQNHKRVRGYKRVIYSGVTTNHLAAVVETVIGKHRDLQGLYQVASEPISKYDLLALIKDAYGLDTKIEVWEEEISDRSMKCEKFRRATGYKCPTWSELVEQLAADPTPYGKWIGRHWSFTL